jgi:Uma2 family endonuclease
MVTAHQRHLTAEEYLSIERRAAAKSEFLDGEMFAMAGASFAHVEIVGNLFVGLQNALKNGSRRPLMSDLRVEVERTGLFTYPDVSVLCGEPRFHDSKNDTLLNPTVLFEVLSQSTEAYDRGKTFHHYRQIESLQVYVLVSQDLPLVESYRRQGENWVLTEFRGLEATLRIEELGVAIPLREIYDRIEFPPPEPPERGS